MNRGLSSAAFWGLVAAVSIHRSLKSQEPEALLDFEAPAEIVGYQGTMAEFEAYATVTPRVAGPEAWSLSLTADGATITEATTAGIMIGERPIDARSMYSIVELATHSTDPSRRGAVAALACVFYPVSRGLPPDVTQRLLKITVEVTLPPGGESRTVTLRHEDGFQGSGIPVNNVMVVEGMLLLPATASRTVLLRGVTTFLRGDANADGDLDIADPIFGLNFLFRGGLAPACERSLDANDDGLLNIIDATVLIRYVFNGGPPPAHPFPACAQEATADALTCLSHPACG